MGNLTLGQKLKNFRKLANLSQAILELEADLAPGSLSRIENDQINPTKETIQRLAECLSLNHWESSYLSGKLSSPATSEEIQDAQTAVSGLFKTPGVLAYMVDDRSIIQDISSSALRLLQLSQKEREKLSGQPIIRLLLDEKLKIKSLIDPDDYPNVLKNLLLRIYNEMYFMSGDESFQYTLDLIKKDSLASRFWKEIEQSDSLPTFYPEESRIVTFKILGKKLEFNYSVENLLQNERFRILQYKAVNPLAAELLKFLI